MKWYATKIKAVTTLIPQKAHQQAAAIAAAFAADGIQTTYTGTLARDVRTPKPEAPLSTLIGSSLPYARAEHFGGPIPQTMLGRRMLIRGRGVSAGAILKSGAISKGAYLLRSTATKGRVGFNPVSGQVSASGIVASAYQVPHPRKLYLDRAVRLYPDAVAEMFRRALAAVP